MNNHTLIQSYVNSKFFVSTIYRESSAAITPTPWYYETIAWEWNSVTRERGKIIAQVGSSSNRKSGFMTHTEVCRQLLETEIYVEPEE